MVLEGAMTALVTPMRDGAVDFDALTQLVDWQIDAGIDALVSVGTTGESSTLTVREHIDVITRTVEAARGRVPVIAGAGANSTQEALHLQKASEEAGADALIHVTPYYNKPTQQGLYRHFSTVADAASLPVVLYNVPGRTGCDMQPDTVARLAEHPRIVALKEASASMKRASEIVALCGDKLTLLSGDDFTAFTLYALGGRGVISVVSNVRPREMAAMWHAAKAGEWERARALHYELYPLTELLFAESSPIPAKAALALMGKMSPELRAPLYEASPELTRKLEAHLRDKGLV
jgi:4-hydroxy-tetrahydrodipicolinate synthase